MTREVTETQRLTSSGVGDSLSDVIEEDPSLEEQRGRLLFRCSAAGRWGRRDGLGAVRLLQDRVALGNLFVRNSGGVFAAEDDLLKEEHMVFSVDIGFRDHEDVVEQEFAEVGKCVSLPVFNSLFQQLNGCCVNCPALRLIGLLSDSLAGSDALLEFLVEFVVGRARLEELLEEEWVLADSLNRLD
jgi:hypothetical protein